MPPGVEKFGFVENLAVFLKGQSAMTISWPPYGRFAAGYLADEKALDWVPKSQVANKVGYTLPPGGHPQLAAGFALSVAASSKQKERRICSSSGSTAKRSPTNACNCRMRCAIRSAIRTSRNKEYLAKWPDAKDYLAALKEGVEDGFARSVLDSNRQVRGSAAPGYQPAVGGRRSEGHPRRCRQAMGRDHPAGGSRQAEGGIRAWAGKPGAYPKASK